MWLFFDSYCQLEVQAVVPIIHTWGEQDFRVVCAGATEEETEEHLLVT